MSNERVIALCVREAGGDFVPAVFLEPSGALAAEYVQFMGAVIGLIAHWSREALEADANSHGKTLNHALFGGIGLVDVKEAGGLVDIDRGLFADAGDDPVGG